MLHPPTGPAWGGDAPSAADTPEDPDRPADEPEDRTDAPSAEDDAGEGEPAEPTEEGEPEAATEVTDTADAPEEAAAEAEAAPEPTEPAAAPTPPAAVEPPAAAEPPAAEEKEDTPPPGTGAASRRPGEVSETPIALWSEEAVGRLREQWRELQVQFIDDPAEAVNGAKELVTAAIQELADTLRSAQDMLDPYRDGESVDTETMRVAMRRYREFLDRVLAL